MYLGTGACGSFAAQLDALRRAERQAQMDATSRCDKELQGALNLALEYSDLCALLVDATLLAAGFHRQLRHRWRRWWNGCRAIRQAG
jgi:hypothetical protein